MSKKVLEAVSNVAENIFWTLAFVAFSDQIEGNFNTILKYIAIMELFATQCGRVCSEHEPASDLGYTYRAVDEEMGDLSRSSALESKESKAVSAGKGVALMVAFVDTVTRPGMDISLYLFPVAFIILGISQAAQGRDLVKSSRVTGGLILAASVSSAIAGILKADGRPSISSGALLINTGCYTVLTGISGRKCYRACVEYFRPQPQLN